MNEISLDKFCQGYNLESIVNKPTCLFPKKPIKNPKFSSCIDLVLTNKQERLLKAKTVETGLSEFHNDGFYRRYLVDICWYTNLLIIKNSEKVS